MLLFKQLTNRKLESADSDRTTELNLHNLLRMNELIGTV